MGKQGTTSFIFSLTDRTTKLYYLWKGTRSGSFRFGEFTIQVLKSPPEFVYFSSELRIVIAERRVTKVSSLFTQIKTEGEKYLSPRNSKLLIR